MVTYHQVKGSQSESPLEIEINISTVYIRSNIQRIEAEEFTGWQYDEMQYTLREFHELIAQKATLNEEYTVDVDFRLTLLEMGLV